MEIYWCIWQKRYLIRRDIITRSKPIGKQINIELYFYQPHIIQILLCINNTVSWIVEAGCCISECINTDLIVKHSAHRFGQIRGNVTILGVKLDSLHLAKEE